MKALVLVLLLVAQPVWAIIPGQDQTNNPLSCIPITADNQDFLDVIYAYVGSNDDCVTYGDIYTLEELVIEGPEAMVITFEHLSILDNFTYISLGVKGEQNYIEGTVFDNIFHPGTIVEGRFIHGLWMHTNFLPGVVMSDGEQQFFTPGLIMEGVGFMPGIAVHEAFGHELSLLFEEPRFTPGIFQSEADLIVFVPGNFDAATITFTPGTILNPDAFNPEIYHPDMFGPGFINLAGIMFDNMTGGEVWENWWENSFGGDAPGFSAFCTVMGAIGTALGALASIFGITEATVGAAAVWGGIAGAGIAGGLLIAGFLAVALADWIFDGVDWNEEEEEQQESNPDPDADPDPDGGTGDEEGGDSITAPCYITDCGDLIIGNPVSISNFFINNLLAVQSYLVTSMLEPVILDPIDLDLEPLF